MTNSKSPQEVDFTGWYFIGQGYNLEDVSQVASAETTEDGLVLTFSRTFSRVMGMKTDCGLSYKGGPWEETEPRQKEARAWEELTDEGWGYEVETYPGTGAMYLKPPDSEEEAGLPQLFQRPKSIFAEGVTVVVSFEKTRSGKPAITIIVMGEGAEELFDSLTQEETRSFDNDPIIKAVLGWLRKVENQRLKK